MDCDLVLSLLYDLVDGELTADDRPNLEAHLRGCAMCRAKLQSLEQAENFYRREIFVEPETITAAEIANNVLQENSSLMAKNFNRETEEKTVLQQNGSVVPLLNWSTRGIIARVSAVAAGLAVMLYLVISLPIAGQFNNRATEVANAFNPTNNLGSDALWRTIGDLKLDSAVRELLATITAGSNDIFSELPVNSSIILMLVLLQIIVSYRLLNKPAKLEQDQQL